jgi:hypothetical protein
MGILRSVGLFAVLASLLTAACGGGGGEGVRLDWDAEGFSVQIAPETAGTPPLKTTVYVTNDSGAVVRDAAIRLRGEGTELQAGLTVGTVTNVSTDFDGNVRVWRLGDLESGKRYGLPIGLWLSSPYLSAAPDNLVLSVELVSPDLDQPLRSELALSLRK